MIRPGNLIDAISDYGVLKDLDPRFLDKLAGLALEAYFPPDHILFREGDMTTTFYLVASGTIALEMVAGARTIRVQTIHEGDAMSWSALLDNNAKHFQARATSHVRALAFEGAKLREAFDQDPAFGYAMMKRLLATVTARLDATRVQLVEMYGKA